MVLYLDGNKLFDVLTYFFVSAVYPKKKKIDYSTKNNPLRHYINFFLYQF